MTERRRDVLALAPLSLAALVLGHDLTFLVTFGPDYRTALIRTGHGEVWVAAVVTALALSIGLVVLAATRLVSLHRQAAAAGIGAGSELHRLDLVRETAGIWGLVFLVAVALFLLNENAERALSAQPLPGLGALIGSGSLPVPALMLGVASALVAFVAALYRCRRDALVARICASARAWSARTAPAPSRPALMFRPRVSPIARRLAGRAPPRLDLLSVNR